MTTDFNRKDYNFVAKRIREQFPTEQIRYYDPDGMRIAVKRGTLITLAIAFAKKYTEDNPAFDPVKFLDACSPDPKLYPISKLWENENG